MLGSIKYFTVLSCAIMYFTYQHYFLVVTFPRLWTHFVSVITFA